MIAIVNVVFKSGLQATLKLPGFEDSNEVIATFRGSDWIATNDQFIRLTEIALAEVSHLEEEELAEG
jgi:hypothetical protein